MKSIPERIKVVLKAQQGSIEMIEKNLLTAIWESWNHFDTENFFKLVKSIPERTVIKTRGEITMN